MPLSITSVTPYGHLSSEPAALLPSTASATIFNVTGGRIVITSLVGTVTAAVGSTAVTLAVGNTPTSGTLLTNGLANASAITSLEVGGMVSLPNAKGALLVSGFAGGAVQVQGYSGYLVEPGAITITTNASPGTGAMKWDCTWLPFDPAGVLSPN